MILRAVDSIARRTAPANRGRAARTVTKNQGRPMFVRHTRQTISGYVMHLRIGEACARLSATTRPVAHIASDVGYNALANFNRQFRTLKGMTPRQYRAKFTLDAR